MSSNEYDILDVLHEMIDSERSFYGIIRFLDGNSRGRVMDAHMRNRSQMLAIMRAYMIASPVTNMVLNIPIGSLDASGNFFDPVPIIPSAQQIHSATETEVPLQDSSCAICQEELTTATRIRNCGHCFHAHCISQWFSMNARCPVCRHDIRSLRITAQQNNNENSSVHSNTE